MKWYGNRNRNSSLLHSKEPAIQMNFLDDWFFYFPCKFLFQLFLLYFIGNRRKPCMRHKSCPEQRQFHSNARNNQQFPFHRLFQCIRCNLLAAHRRYTERNPCTSIEIGIDWPRAKNTHRNRTMLPAEFLCNRQRQPHDIIFRGIIRGQQWPC